MIDVLFALPEASSVTVRCHNFGFCACPPPATPCDAGSTGVLSRLKCMRNAILPDKPLTVRVRLAIVCAELFSAVCFLFIPSPQGLRGCVITGVFDWIGQSIKGVLIQPTKLIN